MTPQPPPTDRPLTAGDVPLLRKGDVLCAIKHCVGPTSIALGQRVVFEATEHGLVGVVGDFWGPSAFTFVSRPATSAASEGAVDRVMAVLNHWFDGRARIDRNSDMVAQLAALASPPVSERERVFMVADDVPVWADGIVTDGERAAIAQKAEADHGGTYWAVDGGDGALDWEPTHFISIALLTAQPAGEGK